MYIKSSSVFKQFSDQAEKNVLAVLGELSFNQVSDVVSGGAADSTVKDFVFVAPTKMKITSAKLIINQVNTGASNTPTVSLRKKTADAEIGTSGAVALGKAVGDAVAITLDADEVEVSKGEVLEVRIVTAAGATVTTALKGRVQIEWHSIEE